MRLILTWVLCADFTLWLLAWVFMAHVPFSGDENFYFSTAAAIADFLSGARSDALSVAAQVFHNGWFMPGMSLLLVPLHLVFDGPGVEITRAYVALINLGLWLWALHEIDRRVGPKSAVALMVFPPLALMWQLFAATIWTDLPAGLMICIATARVYEIAVRSMRADGFVRSMRADGNVSWRTLATLELVLVGAVYLRGSVIAFVLAVHVFLLAVWLISPARRHVLRRTGRLALAFPVFAGLLAPWSGMVSWQLGGPVLTTSTIPISLAITFAPHDRICFGRCPAGNIWYEAADFARDYAKQHQISELEAQRRMAAHALAPVSWDRYWRNVARNFRSFTTQPWAFANRFVGLYRTQLSNDTRQAAIGTVQWATLLIYVPFLLAIALANATVIRRDVIAQLGSLAIKMATLCIFVQPFVHPSHPRYWPLFAPLAALALGWLLGDRAHPAANAAKPDTEGSRLTTLVFTAIQLGYVGIVAGVFALILSV